MVDIYAHRGASAYAPENTMSSFKKAIELGTTGIETDVHLSKDGIIVINHDFMLNRTTDGKGLIKNNIYSDIKEYDAGSWFSDKFSGEHVPTLNELFELVKDTDTKLNIELKAGSRFYPQIEEKVINLISDYNYWNRVIISSFDHHSLIKVKQLNPDIETGVLYGADMFMPWNYAKILEADALHPNYMTVDQNLVKHAGENDLMVNPYTVNEYNDMLHLMNIGVDSIITNYPDKGIEAREKATR